MLAYSLISGSIFLDNNNIVSTSIFLDNNNIVRASIFLDNNNIEWREEHIPCVRARIIII